MFRLMTQDIPFAEADMCHSCGYFYSEDILLCSTCKENIKTTITCHACGGEESFTGTKGENARCVFCRSLLPNVNLIEKEDKERLKFHISYTERDKKND
jgi:ribosomal protein L37E